MVEAPMSQPSSASRWVLIVLFVVAILLIAGGIYLSVRIEVAIRETSLARNVLEDTHRQLDDLRGLLDDSKRSVNDLQRQLADMRHPRDDNNSPIDDPGITESTNGGRGSSKPVVSVADLLLAADELRKEGRLQEAEMILTRAVQTDKDHIEAWQQLAAVLRDRSNVSIKSNNLLSAAREIDRARNAVNSIKSICVDPSTTVDPKVVLEEDELIAKATALVGAAIDKLCKQRIDVARQCESEAYHSSWNVLAIGFRRVRNDRSEVVKGLTYLKPVFELGPWASAETRTSAHVTYSNLKKLVYPEEWSDLLVQAGFDPTARDALKESGLE